MMRSSNLSSRSTFFSSKSMKASSKKKKNTKKILTQRKPLSETEILTKKILNDIIECSIQIADFHIKHKKNQKTYENRKINRFQNFINKDSLFIGDIPPQNSESNNWTFISKLLGKIIYVETKTNLLMIYNFNTNSESPLQFNLGFEEKIIISSELYENEKNMKSILLLLFNDFSFITLDLFLLNQEGQNEDDNLDLIEKSKISEFDFKPYLNKPNIDEYIPKYQNGIKIIIFPKALNNFGADIILNFTQIAGKFLIFNILSNSIIGNYIINQKDYVTTESEYLDNLRILINAFFSKVWSIRQYEVLIQIINSICDDNNNNIFDDLKKLSVLLNMASNDEGDNLSLLLQTKQFIFTQIKNIKSCKERDIEAEKLYSNILLPILSKSNSQSCIISLKTLLIKLKNFFEKLYGCSIAVGKADLSLIEGKFKVYQNLFLKCYNRDINLRQLFLKKDVENNGYVDRKVALEIFKDLPIGLTFEEIDELLTKYNIFDENDKYMYEYLFLLDEQIITKIVFSTPLNLLDGNKFTCGYFINSKNTNNIEFDNIKGKISSPTNQEREELISLDTQFDINKHYGNKINEKCDLTMPEKKLDYEYLLDYVINSCLTIEVTDMVVLTSLNLVFIITPYNQNIPIFKLETKFSNKPKTLEKIGIINLNSYYNNYPGFLFCIEERNLLITQRTTKVSTELVFIDIRKDLLFPFRDNQEINYNISENEINSDKNKNKIVENIFTFEQGRKNIKLIKKIVYLKKSEIITIATDEELYLINPKSHHVEISLKMQEIKRTAYTNICRQFCENPEEQTGEDKFKILKKIDLNQNIKNIYSFFLGNDSICDEQYYKYSNTDWIFLLFEGGVIECFCLNHVILTQKAKEIDTPITEKEKMYLFNFVNKNKNNSLKKYEEEIKKSENNYEQNKLTKVKNINQISLNIKETMLYEKPFELKRDIFEINSIHQLISLIKRLKLNYTTNQIFEMFPYITFGKLKYETDADYFKTELFPTDKNYQELGAGIEEIHLPKNKNELKSDLSSLNSHLKIIDSAIKKLAKFIVDKNISNDYVYKSCAENNEELLDFDQYVEGLKKLGLLGKPYLNEEEMKELFFAMDENMSNILTLDEYNKYLEKIDIYSIKSNVEKEAQKRKNESLFYFDIEKFVNSSEEEKVQTINPILDKVKNFYMNIPDVLYNEVKTNIDLIKNKITCEEIKNRFNHGFIFYEDFHDLMYELIPSIKEEEINKLFAYFDQNNMNLFIYVRDFIKYLNANNNNTLENITNSIEETGQIKKFMTDEQFILIWIGLMKKVLKLCIMELGIFPEQFSEKYIFIKPYNNHLIVLNYIPTEIALEKIKKKITNFLPLEEKILFENYLDYYNYGILYFNSFQEIFDNMMKYINDSDLFDLTKFDTFDSDNANQYINVRKHNINKNEKSLEKNYVENLLPIFDKVIMKFAFYTQMKSGMKNLTFFYNYLREIGEEKDFLTQKEFMKILKDFIPEKNFNAKFAQNLISQLTENVKLINEPLRPVISISRIILFIINVVKKSQFLDNIINTQELDFIENKILFENCNRCISCLSQYNSIMKEINKLSEDYLKIIEDCSLSGLIILNKTLTIKQIMAALNDIDSIIFDYCNYYMNLGNNILVQNFNNLITSKSRLNSEDNIFYNNSLPQNFLSQIEIPEVKINVINLKDMMNLKKYQSGMIENFDFFQPELHCVVNVTKIRKSFLLKQISKDGNNLLNYILDSLKLNHFLQKNYLSKALTKSFDNFLFLRNFGICTKEITINKILEEELYIVNEKIDESEYICLQSLVKSNGGLLFIPEIVDTGIGIYILRSWGKYILNIIQELNKINRCFKYFRLKDFYGTYNGKKLKMANIYSYSLFDENGEMTFGPDISKILMLLDKLPTGDENELTFEKMESIYSTDAYISPEIIKKINLEKPSNKVDSWLYGTLLFNIIFGITPESFYSQLKKYCENYLENCNMEQVLIEDEFDVLKTNFFYNPFSNIKIIMEDKYYFTKILKGNSFSAIIETKYIKDKSKNSYDISIFIDLINACLNIDPEKRPSISDLINFDLFEIPFELKQKYGRSLSNVLEYYSPESVIKEKIVLPLRKICCDVMRNQETKPIVINNYQNYILNVINDLSVYMFQKYNNSEDDLNDDKKSLSSTNNSYDNKDEFMEDNPEYKFRNTVLIKYVVEYKVVDLLIFLVLRHFNTNLKLFKQKIKYESNEEEKNSQTTYSSNINIYPTTTNFNTLIETSNAVLNTNASLTERNTNKRYYLELHKNCGKLISALVQFLYHCVEALNDYNHILCLYVENVLIWIIKLFIGEENELLGCKYDYKVSNDRIKQYILKRTFMRHENIVIQDEFKEDDLDQLFSVLNLNKNLIDTKSYWSAELYYFINPLFREAFGENCSGNYRHSVIKNYFLVVNNTSGNANKVNPLSDNGTSVKKISIPGTNMEMEIKNNFLNTEYVSEIFTIVDILKQLSNKQMNYRKNIETKRNSLNYINIVLKNKNSAKIRGCLDCKIHLIIQKYLFTNINDLGIKKDLFNILKEISLSLVDMNEISWQFGNNYEKIYEKRNNNINKIPSNINIDLENNSCVNDSNWDSNTSLIDFATNILIQPHLYVLNYSNKFLKVNIQKTFTTYQAHMKEFGYIFSSPLILKPIMRCLIRRNENYYIRQTCLEILFNILLSNEIRITSNLNMTMCNFYELLVEILTYNRKDEDWELNPCTGLGRDNFDSGEKEKYFIESVSKAIKIIIEMQNPDIKRQIFNCPMFLKYMEKNKLSFIPRLDLEEIEEEFNKIKDLLNFENLEGKIIFLIDAFKVWVYENKLNSINKNMSKIRNIMVSLHHIFNNEWNNGLKTTKKNCLIFNIVKLYEWIIVYDHREFLFPKNSESFTSTIIISFMSKIKDNSEIMKKIALELNRMINTSNFEKNKNEYGINLFANNAYTLNKMYNYISLKLLNIIYSVFYLGDNYYNAIFNKLKIGLLISELFVNQLETLSLFLNFDNIDISILNNYMAEVKIRLGFIESISSLPKNFDDIKMQFLQSDFINYIFKYMIDDMRYFRTNSKKLTLEFIQYKNSFPLRNEAMTFLDIIFKKYYDIKKRTETDCFIFDEIIRNVKVFHLVQNQLSIIKTKIKGNEVLSVLGFFNMVLKNNEREIIKIMNSENAKDYFIYALQKETHLKKMFPLIVEYISKLQAGIEK